MPNKDNTIPVAVLHERFVYDPSTGVLIWKTRDSGQPSVDAMWNARVAGTMAGRPHRHGHWLTSIAYPRGVPKNYANHRIAWAMYYGEWPRGNVDHINGIPHDNRISNLRLATQTQNMQNTKLRSDNTSGVKGVYWVKRRRKWSAFISYGGKVRNLGSYATKEEAISVRRAAAERHFGQFVRRKEHGG